MASLAPPERPYDWANESDTPGVTSGVLLATVIAIAAFVLGILVLYNTWV